VNEDWTASKFLQDLLDKENDDSKDDTEDIKDLKARVQQLKDQLSKALQGWSVSQQLLAKMFLLADQLIPVYAPWHLAECK